MAIKQRLNNLTKETEFLQTKRVENGTLKNDLLAALTWKKAVRQKVSKVQEKAMPVEVKDKGWKKAVRQKVSKVQEKAMPVEVKDKGWKKAVRQKMSKVQGKAMPVDAEEI